MSLVPSPPPKAIVLVSGGLDSATVLAIAKQQGFECYALSFDYGQRHRVELAAAQRVCQNLGVKQHSVVNLDLRAFGGSALTAEIDVPKDRDPQALSTGIPVTYVPARNTIFLSIALGWAEVLGAFDLFAGMNAVDYSGYPDCRPEFLKAFEQLANLATKAGVEGTGQFRLHTPLLQMTKPEIIRRGLELGVDFSWTHSCYDTTPEGRPCGHCDSCQIRQSAFAVLNMTDPGA